MAKEITADYFTLERMMAYHFTIVRELSEVINLWDASLGMGSWMKFLVILVIYILNPQPLEDSESTKLSRLLS
jgi:hypothetical protein